MGGWTFVEPRLRELTRPSTSSTSAGTPPPARRQARTRSTTTSRKRSDAAFAAAVPHLVNATTRPGIPAVALHEQALTTDGRAPDQGSRRQTGVAPKAVLCPNWLKPEANPWRSRRESPLRGRIGDRQGRIGRWSSPPPRPGHSSEGSTSSSKGDRQGEVRLGRPATIVLQTLARRRRRPGRQSPHRAAKAPIRSLGDGCPKLRARRNRRPKEPVLRRPPVGRAPGTAMMHRPKCRNGGGVDPSGAPARSAGSAASSRSHRPASIEGTGRRKAA